MIRTALILATFAAATAATVERHASFDTNSLVPKKYGQDAYTIPTSPGGPGWIKELGTSNGIASESERRVLPPIEHDHPYAGKLKLIRVKTEKEVSALCPATTFRYKLGCAYPATQSCRVIIVGDGVLEKAGYTYETVLRHELGHCNGWGGDHWGARVAPTPAEAKLVERARTRMPRM